MPPIDILAICLSISSGYYRLSIPQWTKNKCSLLKCNPNKVHFERQLWVYIFIFPLQISIHISQFNIYTCMMCTHSWYNIFLSHYKWFERRNTVLTRIHLRSYCLWYEQPKNVIQKKYIKLEYIEIILLHDYNFVFVNGLSLISHEPYYYHLQGKKWKLLRIVILMMFT